MSKQRKISILDIMGPVMVGPSSSHTAGTARLGRVANAILGEEPVKLRFYLHPPLEKTFRGHGADFALVGGSVGLAVNDPRIPESIRLAEEYGIDIDFTSEDLGDVHPNTVRIVATGPNREVEVIGSSIGGGVIDVFGINGFKANYKGNSPTLMMLYRDRPAMIHQVTGMIAEEAINIASLHCSRKRRGKEAFMHVDLDSPLSQEAMGRIRDLEGVSSAIYLDAIP